MAFTQFQDQSAKTLLSLGVASDPTLRPPSDLASPFLTPGPCLENASLKDHDLRLCFLHRGLCGA